MRDPNRRFDVPPKDVSPLVNREAQAINRQSNLQSGRRPPVSGRRAPGRKIRPLASLRAHQFLALSIIFVILLVGIVASWWLGKTTFYTEAVIYVSPPHERRAAGDRTNDSDPNSRFRDYLQQQLKTVNRYDIVLATLRSQPELARSWRHANESEQRAVERLQSALVVRTVPNTSLFTVGLEDEKGDRLAELVNALVNTYIKRERADDLKRRDQYVLQLQAEQKRLTDELVQKQTQLGRTNRLAAADAAASQEVLTLEYEVESLRKRLLALDDHLNASMLGLEVPGFTRLFESAREPESPITDGRRKYLIFAFLLAFALGVTVPVTVDQLDPRLRSVAEVEGVLGFSPIASVADAPDGENQNLARDQITRLAYLIDRERRHYGSKVFLFTSAQSGGGTTTLVLDLAQALSRLEIRTIALEAGAIKPDSNYVMPDNDLGLIDVLTARCRVSEAINPETESQPERMSVGRLGNQQQLPDIQYLPGTLRLLADRYDVILLDAAPLLESSDTELLVGFSDSTVLVLEAASVHRKRALQAVKLLESLSVPEIKIVFNRVPADQMDQAGPLAPAAANASESSGTGGIGGASGISGGIPGTPGDSKNESRDEI